jgi:hypothetical protein
MQLLFRIGFTSVLKSTDEWPVVKTKTPAMTISNPVMTNGFLFIIAFKTNVLKIDKQKLNAVNYYIIPGLENRQCGMGKKGEKIANIL